MSEEAFLEREARRRGITVTQLKMLNAVPDDVMRSIVSDNRHGIAQSTSLIPTTERSEPQRRGNGWSEPRPLQPPPGVRLIDQLCKAQDAKDKAERR